MVVDSVSSAIMWMFVFPAAVIGTRLHFLVAMSCVCMAIYVMLIK